MKQVLLVDDDASLLGALTRELRQCLGEWRVACAQSGREALTVARALPPDLVITDLLMPELDGMETMAALRRDHPLAKIVVMSGGGKLVGKEALRSAELLGADATLQKPFRAEELAAIVRQLFPPLPPPTA